MDQHVAEMNRAAARPVTPIAAVFAGIALFRLALLGRGTMAFLDETMYYKAGLALDELRHGHLAAAITHIASNNGRPGNALIQLVPAALQAVPFAFGVSPSNPWSLLIPGVWNVLLTLASLYFFWRISLMVFEGDRVAATAGVVIYGLLANSNVYVRHLLANEPALCVGMATLWIALSRRSSWPRAAAVGALSAFTVTVYPGYVTFALIPCLAVSILRSGATPPVRARLAVGAAVGGATAIAAMELFCRLGGISYVETARTLSRTISQGSFEEGWRFLPEYLLRVERGAGIVLLCGTAVFVVQAARRAARESRVRTLDWLVLAAIAGWFSQAFGSAVTHSAVLYGRLIHPWMPFFVWATIDGIRSIGGATNRRACYLAALAVSIASCLWFAWAYLPTAYPSDVLYALRIDSARIPAAQWRCAMTTEQTYASPAPLDRRTGAPYGPRHDFVLVNFCQGEPSAARAAAVASMPCPAELFRAPHFMAVPAYGFEGLTPAQRADIARPEYDIRVCVEAIGAVP